MKGLIFVKLEHNQYSFKNLGIVDYFYGKESLTYCVSQTIKGSSKSLIDK